VERNEKRPTHIPCASSEKQVDGKTLLSYFLPHAKLFLPPRPIEFSLHQQRERSGTNRAEDIGLFFPFAQLMRLSPLTYTHPAIKDLRYYVQVPSLLVKGLHFFSCPSPVPTAGNRHGTYVRSVLSEIPLHEHCQGSYGERRKAKDDVLSSNPDLDVIIAVHQRYTSSLSLPDAELQATLTFVNLYSSSCSTSSRAN